MKERYIIDDIDKFTEGARSLVFNTFGKKDEDQESLDVTSLLSLPQAHKDELDSMLSQKESMVIVKNLVKKQTHKITKKSRYIIDINLFMTILEELNSRLVSNLLVSLSKKGLIESAYDEKLNDFVFWVKDENIQDKPETD